MKRVLAFTVYMLGSVAALKVAVEGLSGVAGLNEWFSAFAGIAFACFVWWVTASAGVALGVRPSEWLSNIGRGLGFGPETAHSGEPGARRGR